MSVGGRKFFSCFFLGHLIDVCFPSATNLCGMDGFLIFVHSLWNWFPYNCCSFVSLAVIQCTHHTSFPHLTGWFSSCHREGRWRGLPGSSARYPGSIRPRRPRRWSCPRCPRPAHPLGYRWHSNRWTQWWRLPLGPTPSPNIKGSVGNLWRKKELMFRCFQLIFFNQSYTTHEIQTSHFHPDSKLNDKFGDILYIFCKQTP